MISYKNYKIFTHINFTLLFLFFSLIANDGFAQLGKQRFREATKFKPPLLPAYGDQVIIGALRYDFFVTMRDGVRIDCLKFIPVGSIPPGGWPTVIMVHGYGDNKETLAEFCRAQALYGYYTMTFSVRGQGKSGGLSNLISTVERDDMLEIINYVRADSVSGSSPNNILIMGGSQGGLLPFMASCNGAPVKTIISALAPPDFASSWIENGCIKITFLWTIEYTPDTARYTPLVDRMSEWVYEDTKEKWDSLAYWLPIGRDFMNQVPNSKVPMIMEASWQDKFFNTSGNIKALNMLTAPFCSYIGAVMGHGGDTSYTENLWHMQWFNDWFFYWLFGINNGILEQPKYHFAYTTYPTIGRMWSFIHDTSRVPYSQFTTPLRLYFNKNNRLTSTPNSNSSDRVVLRNEVTGGLTMREAVYLEFTGPVFNSKFRKRTLFFQTDPLASDLKWVGIPKIRLDYSSTANTFCQYNFQLYEVKPNGETTFINRLNYTDRNYVRESRRNRLFEGQAHAHIFKAGNRIRLVVTNLDTAPTDTSFMSTYPFVLPVLINSSNRIFLSTNSYIELPVKTLTTENLSSLDLTNSPYCYSLKQNYPNPFNPITTIEYTIAKSNKVVLKIYDLLGREIKTLVNEFQQAGSHNVLFDASGLASGIYFYKITSGDWSSVKKMILLK